MSISSPFYNDGLVYVYSLDNSNSRISTKPFHTIDVEILGDVEGCYAEGPNKFGFGISTSFNNNKLLIGSLKDFVHLIEYKDGIPFRIDIPNPSLKITIKSENLKLNLVNQFMLEIEIYMYLRLKMTVVKEKFLFILFAINRKNDDQNPWTNPYMNSTCFIRR